MNIRLISIIFCTTTYNLIQGDESDGSADKAALYPGYIGALNSTLLNLIAQLQVYTKYIDQAFQPLNTYDRVFPQPVASFNPPVPEVAEITQVVRTDNPIPAQETGDSVSEAAPTSVNVTEATPEVDSIHEDILELLEDSRLISTLEETGPEDLRKDATVSDPKLTEGLTSDTSVTTDDSAEPAGSERTDLDVRFGQSDSMNPVTAEGPKGYAAEMKKLPEYPKCGFAKEEQDLSALKFSVAIGKDEDGGFSLICGGTLINTVTLITSADCLSAENVTVVRTFTGELHQIRETIINAGYVRGGLYNDIALVKLDTPVNIASEALPCLSLPAIHDLQAEYVVTDWGFALHGKTLALMPKKRPAKLYSSSECEASYRIYFEDHDAEYYDRFRQGLDPTLMCTALDAPDGPCEDDGGYQLLRKSRNSWSLLGTRVKTGIYCDDMTLPRIYTYVAPFKSWITSNL